MERGACVIVSGPIISTLLLRGVGVVTKLIMRLTCALLVQQMVLPGAGIGR